MTLFFQYHFDLLSFAINIGIKAYKFKPIAKHDIIFLTKVKGWKKMLENIFNSLIYSFHTSIFIVTVIWPEP